MTEDKPVPAWPDLWATDPSVDSRDMSLREYMREAAVTPTRIDDQPSQIAVRVAPVGFRGIMRQLAREQRVSYSALMSHALDHGMAILDAQVSVIALRDAYDLTNAAAMSSGDQEALARLNQVATFDFKHPQTFRTTLSVSRNTSARVGDLAIICGMPAPRLAVVTVLVSVLTLPNNRGYREALLDEVEAFHRFVIYRRRVLLLGEGHGSADARMRLRLT